MGEVESAVEAQLERMGPAARASGLGASAVDLARRQDAADPNSSAAASIARELRAHLVELVKLYPPAAEDDELTRLRKRRERGA